MLSKCTTKISPDQIEWIMQRFHRIVRLYREKGEASDADFEGLGFNLIQEEDSKDSIVLNCRRAVIFNNEGYLRIEIEK